MREGAYCRFTELSEVDTLLSLSPRNLPGDSFLVMGVFDNVKHIMLLLN